MTVITVARKRARKMVELRPDRLKTVMLTVGCSRAPFLQSGVVSQFEAPQNQRNKENPGSGDQPEDPGFDIFK